MYLTKNRKERCVMARIVRQRKLYQGNFSLREYKNWGRATAAAEKWIRGLLKNLPPPLRRRDRPTASNRSGVVGVHLHRAERKRNGRKVVYRSWIAWWPECKIHGGVKWSVMKLGEDEAFVLAVLCRRMEADVRARVLEKFNATRGTAEFEKIAELRRGRRKPKAAAIVDAIEAPPTAGFDQAGAPESEPTGGSPA
jgi:hypothetical protein